MHPDDTPKRSRLFSLGNILILFALGALLYAGWYASQLPRTSPPSVALPTPTVERFIYPTSTPTPTPDIQFTPLATTAPVVEVAAPSTPIPAVSGVAAPAIDSSESTLSTEQDYAGAMQMALSMFAESSGVLQTRVTELGTDASYLSNTDWRKSVEDALNMIDGFTVLVPMLEPPPVFQAVHAEVAAAGSDLSQFTPLFRQGINEVNMQALQSAMQFYQSATAHVTAANAILQTITPTP